MTDALEAVSVPVTEGLLDAMLPTFDVQPLKTRLHTSKISNPSFCRLTFCLLARKVGLNRAQDSTKVTIINYLCSGSISVYVGTRNITDGYFCGAIVPLCNTTFRSDLGTNSRSQSRIIVLQNITRVTPPKVSGYPRGLFPADSPAITRM